MNEGLSGLSSGNYSRESNMSLCNLSSSRFATIKNTITFVDKTLFIKTVMTDPCKVVLLTAPGSFGKTTLKDMLMQFLLGETSLFKDLNIYTQEKNFFLKHCKLHPVIHIDFWRVREKNLADVKHALAYVINDVFRKHRYLVKETDDGKLVWASEKLNISDIQVERFEKFYRAQKRITLSESDLQDSLRFLSKVLHTHYEEKVFLLIDDYDSPTVTMVLNKDDIELVDDFLKSFMANTLQFNDFLERSLIFACVRLAGAYSGDAAGDAAGIITHYPFLSEPRYAPYFGFTSEEVEHLLQIPEVIKATSGKITFETIKKWYGGYIMSGDRTLKIFNSWSVLKFLVDTVDRYRSSKLKYSSYWTDTAHLRKLKTLFGEPSIREKIKRIINCGNIKIRTVKSITVEDIKTLNELASEFVEMSGENVDLFLQFLADCGYFNIFPVDEKNYEIEADDIIEEDATDRKYENTEYDSTHSILKMPNFEIMQHLKDICYSQTIFNKYNCV